MVDFDKLEEECRSYNIGTSDYSKNNLQPWDVWLAWKLDPWDADIIKRIYRHKEGTPKKEDYEKIIHDCLEKIRQINNEVKNDITVFTPSTD